MLLVVEQFLNGLQFGLLLFLPFDGLASLYVVSALFGFFQGGLVPSYAIIVREYFPPTHTPKRHGASTNWSRP